MTTTGMTINKVDMKIYYFIVIILYTLLIILSSIKSDSRGQSYIIFFKVNQGMQMGHAEQLLFSCESSKVIVMLISVIRVIHVSHLVPAKTLRSYPRH